MVNEYLLIGVFAAIWVALLIASFMGKVRGTIWLLLYLVIWGAMNWVGEWLSAIWVSVINSALFLLLLVWIATVNKHSIRRRN